MRASTIVGDGLLQGHGLVFGTCVGYGSIELRARGMGAPDATDVVLSFDELHLAESPTMETVAQSHEPTRSSANNEHSVRLEGHRIVVQKGRV